MYGEAKVSKIAKKMIIPISFSIVSITIISLLLNSFFIQKYSLYQRKKELTAISKKVKIISEEKAENKQEQKKEFSLLERMYNVTIVTFPNLLEENAFNDELRTQLKSRNIGFIKLWLWKEDYQKLQQNKEVIKLYDQERLQYSILVKYLIVEDKAYIITMNIPYMKETIHIINFFTICIFSVGEIVVVFLIIYLVRKVTTPLTQLTKLAKDISAFSFQKAEIYTKDEIEDLADSFNQMSKNLEEAQRVLKEKNQSMENLISNVSHEIKTPIALIKAYTSGIKDGIDDGSFFDVIIVQTEKINQIVETLLHLSHIKKDKLDLSMFSLSDLVKQIIYEDKILLDTKEISFYTKIEDNIFIFADKEDIKVVITNLFTNAIKYAKIFIQLSLIQKKENIIFEISNGILEGTKLEEEKIWDPFYVGEKSRNKELSGTGLGLSLVKEILEQHKFIYGCKIENQKISFYFKFKIEMQIIP